MLLYYSVIVPKHSEILQQLLQLLFIFLWEWLQNIFIIIIIIVIVIIIIIIIEWNFHASL